MASRARTISWSGYTWNVRPAGTAQSPGQNDWSDSAANVQVQGSDLLLSITQDSSGNWTSSEVDNQQHLGYGTYRWVVATDLSALDANEVLGLFTYGGSDPSNNEIDIEASHWGDMSTPTGSGTVWQDANAGVSEGRAFSYSSRPPYVNQFTWSAGRIDYLVTDATGATLLAWTVTTGVPTPSTEVPVINYWRFKNVAPASVRTMRISSFAWAPLGQSVPPLTNPAGTGSAPSTPGAGAGGTGTSSVQAPSNGPGASPRPPRRGSVACVIGAPTAGARGTRSGRSVAFTVFMQPNVIPLASLPGAGVLRWSATGPASIDLVIRRRVRSRGFVRMGALRRSLRSGRGRFRLPRQLGGHIFGRGTYSVGLASTGRTVRCARRHFAFTVT